MLTGSESGDDVRNLTTRVAEIQGETANFEGAHTKTWAYG
jgi:hypothetical protein